MTETMLMKAVQAVEVGGTFVVSQVPVPVPGPRQVRVKVHACGVCAGENIARMGMLGVTYPRVPGHEVAGEIDSVGAEVTTWKPGDRVGVGWHGGSCSNCEYCRQGDFTNCIDRMIVGASYDGGYAEYMVVPQDALARIPNVLSFAEAAPLMCAGITTFNALRHSGARPGDTVAIHGVGGLGHLAVQFANKMGFRTVAVSRGRAKEALARKLGADEYIDSTEGSAGEALARLGGATVVLSTVGSGAAQVDLTLGLKPNGRLVFVATDHQPLGVSPDLLVFGRRSIAGWYSGNAKDSEETMAFAALKGVRAMIETYPLEDAEEVFLNMGKAKFRSVLTI
ncbi:alcohol dehydrogenase catalytic domain-containing protein [Pseudomonas chlororaphis]|uniref:alcohol dehydrogenase catalytic domain-containing protein n=1 Tax=Pseudomonas chlororaphis TaxID=587753 RepID=UPI000F472975|nr:alcohol dehydrogenase catalytic domain-containing protein [Pseudomonas chlororaphis]ROL89735.1 alcohol dehydrogenase [Pseudomonas chlororaphis]